MTTETITIRVTPRIAQLFRIAPQEVQQKIELLINHQIDAAFDSSETLTALMTRISHIAQARGMTPEILQDILNDND
ncbi:hypothetical protein [Candidatus Oscillochloris fontis]|uniref:hypothetical protein n=1 Tax=Candidatus Oscillochloris fontis TaxID=2496868 RepID=UPI00101CED7C|nr:hypothetical protein [Candidatus Oscillochloris fontis]